MRFESTHGKGHPMGGRIEGVLLPPHVVSLYPTMRPIEVYWGILNRNETNRYICGRCGAKRSSVREGPDQQRPPEDHREVQGQGNRRSHREGNLVPPVPTCSRNRWQAEGALRPKLPDHREGQLPQSPGKIKNDHPASRCRRTLTTLIGSTVERY